MSTRLAGRIAPVAAALAVMSGGLLAPAMTADAAGAASMPSTRTPDRAAEWWLTALGVPQAWKALAAARPGGGITVAVLSTGVDPSHPDLNDSVITGPDYSKSGASPGDRYWGFEGTAVASLIAGHGHGPGGTQGITGVAPGAKILSLRVTLEYNDNARNADPAITRALPGAIAAGIRYAVSHGASVIALPLDPGTLGPLMTGDPTAAGGSVAEAAAVKAALAANVVLVAPAGDNAASTRTVTYPAAYPGVIAVGATDTAGHLEPFSSTRPYVALTAPGGGLTAAAPGGGYDAIQTTDMSAALTAGVAAVIRGRYPRLSAAQVARAIELAATAQAAGGPKAGTGTLNAARALNEAASIAATLSPPAPKASPVKPSPAASKAGSPAAQRGQAADQVTASESGIGGMTKSILRDAAIGAGILIVALIGLLLLARSRRRKARAERLGQAASRMSTAQAGRPGGRATTGGFPTITGGFHALSSHGTHAAPRGTASSGNSATGGQRAIGTAGGRRAITVGSPRTTGSQPAISPAATRPPHPAPLTRTGPLSALGRPPVPTDRPYGTIPWEPARMPADAASSSPWAPQPLPHPPWERPVPGGLAAAPLPDDGMTLNVGTALNAGTALNVGAALNAGTPPNDMEDTAVSEDTGTSHKDHTGPMYIWNPATNSGPFPVLDED